ncbi:DUF4350 domain-containing protein [Ornithinicoccus hortensis]|uniref:Uncharacterized protein DUF4350 n=1 Tax=Ornithinicoccus hortensis TaxID=82346 RepID=A0A542YQ97_9MICO|nr:DUF4350 domain-containing protein [Ornithinicoccus hortensis]TQL50266.1 uncharacterized protein DUF4350 [Ornithinicoccus hortensis]
MTGARTRRLALWVGVLLVVAVASAVLAGMRGSNQLPLDPENPEDGGMAALARVLEQQGVEVTIARGLPALERQDTGPGTTVLVSGTSLLGTQAGDTLMARTRDADTLLVLNPSQNVGDLLDLPVRVTERGLSSPAGAGCEDTATNWREGDRLARGDVLVDVTGDRELARACFPPSPGYNAGGAMSGYVVQLAGDTDRPLVVLAGIGSALTNEHIETEAHAAIGLRLLGASERLVWYVPAPGDAGEDATAQSLIDVLPDLVVPSTVLLLVALATTMVWRGRRLGRVVTEPLPAVVRSVETTQSRSRMYQRAGDRQRALASLQLAARRRIAVRLGLPATSDPGTVVQQTALATGRHTDELRRVLADPTAPDDETLVRIAREVRSIEEGMIG